MDGTAAITRDDTDARHAGATCAMTDHDGRHRLEEAKRWERGSSRLLPQLRAQLVAAVLTLLP